MLSCILALTFALVLLPQAAFADDLQDQIDELRRQRLAIAEEHDEKQAIVDQLEEEKASVVLRKQAMDDRNALTRQQIESLQQEILLTDQLIAREAIRVEQAVALENQQLERYRTRVRAMEENGELGYLGLLLQVDSLSDLLTAIDDAGDIMRSDEELYNDYIAAREYTQAVKAQYETQKAELEARKADLQQKQEALEEEIREAAQLVTELQQDIDERNEELQQLLLDEIETAERIDKLVEEQERRRREEEERRRQEEERRRQEEEARRQQQEQQQAAENTPGGSSEASENDNGGAGSAVPITITGTGSWGWPCPGCYYITSRYGTRTHPITGAVRSHSGLDIGADYGTAIVASDSGVVIMAYVNGGYGNCIMIDHGNGYYSLYGHLSAYAIYQGQQVTKGQTIGYVGDTGWATGPHLHFEIRQGSTCLDPESTGGFSGLSYAPDA